MQIRIKKSSFNGEAAPRLGDPLRGSVGSDDSNEKPSQKRSQPPSAKFLTVKDVADRWGISRRHVQRFIESGELKVHRFGRSVRIALDDVLLFELRCRGRAI